MNCGKGSLVRSVGVKVGGNRVIALVNPGKSKGSAVLGDVAERLGIVKKGMFFSSASLLGLPCGRLTSGVTIILASQVGARLVAYRSVITAKHCPCAKQLKVLARRSRHLIRRTVRTIRTRRLNGHSFGTVDSKRGRHILLTETVYRSPSIVILSRPASFLSIGCGLRLLSVLRQVTQRGGVAIVVSLRRVSLTRGVSSGVVYIGNRAVSRCKDPRSMFARRVVHRLCKVGGKCFSPLFKDVRLPTPRKRPRIFIVSSNKAKVPICHQLRGRRVPFTTNVLCRGSVSCQLTELLTTRIVARMPFRRVQRRALRGTFRAVKGYGHIVGTKIGVNT